MTNSLAILAAVQAGARLLLGGDQVLAQKLRNKAIVLNSPAQITVGFGLASDQGSAADLITPIMEETVGFQAWQKEADLWLLDANAQPLSPSGFYAAVEHDETLQEKNLQSYAVFRERYGDDVASEATLKESLMRIPEIPQFFGNDDPNRPLSSSAQFGLLLIDAAAAYLAIDPAP